MNRGGIVCNNHVATKMTIVLQKLFTDFSSANHNASTITVVNFVSKRKLGTP
jgi:hypothetical protein